MDDILKYYWGWHAEWFGLGRMLWFAVAIDCRHRCAYVVLFGLCVSYGRQIDQTVFTTTTTAPEAGGE